MDRGILDSEERVRPKTDLLEEMLCFWYSLFNRVTFRYILAIWGEGFVMYCGFRFSSLTSVLLPVMVVSPSNCGYL